METKEYFFSKKNLARLTAELGNNLDIDTEDSRGMTYCSKMLYEKVMPNIWDKYKNSVNKYPLKKVIIYLNKKSIELSQDIFNNKVEKKSVSQMGIDRENEISGNRRNIAPRHPQATKMQQKKGGIGMMESEFGMNSFGGYANFNSDDNIMGQQPFIRADGNMGNNFQTSFNQNEYFDGGKKKSEAQEDIEGRLAQQMQERGMGINVRSYNQNQNQNPQEINFCVDGGDTRGRALEEGNNNNNNEMMYDGFGGNMMGIGEYGGLTNGVNNDYSDMNMGNMNNMNNMNAMGNMGNMGNMNNMNAMGNINNMNNMNAMGNINNMNTMGNTGNINKMNNQNSQMEDMMNMFQTMMSTMMNNMAMMNNTQMLNNPEEYDDVYSKKSSEYKKSIANKLGMDPQSLLNLSSLEIEKIIKSKKKKTQKSSSDSDSKSDSNSDSDSREEKSKKKVKKDEILLKLKKLAELKSANIEKQKKIETKLSKKKKNQKSESESETESESESNSDSEPKMKIKKELVKKELTKTKIIVINSEKIEEKVENKINLSDYLVDFNVHYKNILNKGKQISGIKKITIDEINLQMVPKITEKTNTFSIFCDEDYDIVLNPGDYTLEEIIEGFNENYDSEGCGIIVSEKDGFICVKQNTNEVFDMDCSVENSICGLLGFEKKKYSGSSKYISERRHAFNNKPIYMYIININEKEPFAKINMDGSFEQYIEDFAKPLDLELIVIQFRTKNKNNDKNNEKDNEKELINFGEIPHEITLKFEVLNK